MLKLIGCTIIRSWFIPHWQFRKIFYSDISSSHYSCRWILYGHLNLNFDKRGIKPWSSRSLIMSHNIRTRNERSWKLALKGLKGMIHDWSSESPVFQWLSFGLWLRSNFYLTRTFFRQKLCFNINFNPTISNIWKKFLVKIFIHFLFWFGYVFNSAIFLI